MIEKSYPDVDPLDLIQFLSGHPKMLPWRSNPMSIFLFLSLGGFKHNWEEWMHPCLKRLGFPVRLPLTLSGYMYLTAVRSIHLQMNRSSIGNSWHFRSCLRRKSSTRQSYIASCT